MCTSRATRSDFAIRLRANSEYVAIPLLALAIAYVDLFRGMRANINRSPSLRVIGTHVFDKMPQVRQDACKTVIGLLADRKISPAIMTRLPLADAPCAHQMLESRESMGKILLRP